MLRSTFLISELSLDHDNNEHMSNLLTQRSLNDHWVPRWWKKPFKSSAKWFNPSLIIECVFQSNRECKQGSNLYKQMSKLKRSNK